MILSISFSTWNSLCILTCVYSILCSLSKHLLTCALFYYDVLELNPEELAPLDAFGVPKYKGRKRGRKPKKRKRLPNPNRQKRQHTAYTLFVQENYPGVRAQYPDVQSKDIIGMVARQWANVPDIEKQVWKERALETHHVAAAEEVVHEEEEEGEEEDEEVHEEEEEEEAEGDEEEEPSPRRRGRPRKKA